MVKFWENNTQTLDSGLVQQQQQQQLDSLARGAGEERRIRVRIRTPATERTRSAHDCKDCLLRVRL